MNLGLEGKVAVVSGGSRGIGASVVRAFLEEGAKVAFFARTRESVDRALAALEQSGYTNGVVFGSVADAVDADSVGAFVTEVVEWAGRIDVAVANVGSGKSVPDPLPSPEEFSRMIDLNLAAAVNFLRACEDRLMTNKGNAVLISSIAGGERIGAPVAYSSAKAALGLMAKQLSSRWAPDVRINTVIPGNVYFPGGRWEELQGEDPGGVAAMLEREVPLQRFGTPQEVADAVLFLSSERAEFITGACIRVDGGQSRAVQL